MKRYNVSYQYDVDEEQNEDFFSTFLFCITLSSSRISENQVSSL